MKPTRIQLRRAGGWRMPAGAMSVARPTKWGNPFVVGSIVSVTGHDHAGLIIDGWQMPLTADNVVALYRDLIEFRCDVSNAEGLDGEDAAYFHEWSGALELLRGKNLACWCRPSDPCHADVLLELANR